MPARQRRRRLARACGATRARHRSPNAGWPEAAIAGALGLRLAGPRPYGGELVDDAWIGDGRAAATPADIRQARLWSSPARSLLTSWPCWLSSATLA